MADSIQIRDFSLKVGWCWRAASFSSCVENSTMANLCLLYEGVVLGILQVIPPSDLIYVHMSYAVVPWGSCISLRVNLAHCLSFSAVFVAVTILTESFPIMELH